MTGCFGDIGGKTEVVTTVGSGHLKKLDGGCVGRLGDGVSVFPQATKVEFNGSPHLFAGFRQGETDSDTTWEVRRVGAVTGLIVTLKNNGVLREHVHFSSPA